MKLHEEDLKIQKRVESLQGNYTFNVPKKDAHFAIRNTKWYGSLWMKFQPRYNAFEVYLRGNFSSIENQISSMSSVRYYDDNKYSWKYKIGLDKLDSLFAILKNIDEFHAYD